MIQNPILKVLSTLQESGVPHLLMGGQACVLYGALEFTRDIDITLHCDQSTLSHLGKALEKLHAQCIAVPPFEAKFLEAGHSVHFRTSAPGVEGVRLDIMSRMRGVDTFETLHQRRTEIELPNGLTAALLSLPDLVKAKKTQRDKDWPVISRLVAIDYLSRRDIENPPIEFWLRELREPSLIIESVSRFPEHTNNLVSERSLLQYARALDPDKLRDALYEEEKIERAKDRAYWEPLKQELEKLRHAKVK